MIPRRPLATPFWLLSRNVQIRTLIAAPREGSGPLMSRRSDRALPSLGSSWRWLKTLPLFAALMGVSTLAIFNYQKSNSSVVSSTLYALRTNDSARELLGDEVYFASKVPWIRGELNQLHGRIDISFWVKGSRKSALMRFKSVRKMRLGQFEIEEWSLKTEDGKVHQLLEAQGMDPLVKSNLIDANA